MNKPSDVKVAETIQRLIKLPQHNLDAFYSQPLLKNRTLLHSWSLSRVERLSLRSPEMPNLIFKAFLPPLHNELNVYQHILQKNPGWAPTLYGATRHDEERWLFLEDVGARTFKSEATNDNLLRVTATLAELHATFELHELEADNHNLKEQALLPVRDYPAYLVEARQALVFTRSLVAKGFFPSVTPRHLAKLEAVVNMYDRVAMVLGSAPKTLVHGDFNPENIILDNTSGPLRVVLLDWANSYIGAGLVDLVDLATFVTSTFGPDAISGLIICYLSAYEAAGGQPVERQAFEELFVCSQIEKKIGQIRWFGQCALKWIPTGRQAFDQMVAGLTQEVYELSTILI